MLNKITGEVRVFTREIELASDKKKALFNVNIGSTYVEEEESYINYYVLCNFSEDVKKEVAKLYKPDCSFDMVIKEAWFKAYKDKEGRVQPILFVNKAKVVIEEENPEKPTKKAKKTKLKPMDDLPF